jgi:hypothetical protein
LASEYTFSFLAGVAEFIILEKRLSGAQRLARQIKNAATFAYLYALDGKHVHLDSAMMHAIDSK